MLTNAGPTIVVGTRTRGTRVSSSPSKIPYGGFSPVRLQTGIRPRPSPTRSGSNWHPMPAYTRLKSRSRKRATSRSGTCVQAALSPSDRTLPSRGPWLASGFCCPAGSLLTMTSSETLGPSRRLIHSPPGRTWAERFPNLLCLSLSSVPPSVPRQTGRLHLAVASSPAVAFSISVLDRHLHPPRVPVPAWPYNGAAKFALCYGPEESLALHRPGRLRSSFHLPGHPKEASNITTRVNQPIPAAGLAPARQAALWAAGRELLDHVIVLSESHLRRLVQEDIQYYHEDRIHDALRKETPTGRVVEPRPIGTANVAGVPRVGGLHHRYIAAGDETGWILGERQAVFASF